MVTVPWSSFLPIFSSLCHSILNLESDMGQTNGETCRWRPSTLNAPTLWGQGYNNSNDVTSAGLCYFSKDGMNIVLSAWWRYRLMCHSVLTSSVMSHTALCAGCSMYLWSLTLQNVLGEATNDDAEVNTAEDFAAFFRDKVESVRASTMTIPPHDVRHRLTPTLERWTPVTIAEVEKLIASAPCKTCPYRSHVIMATYRPQCGRRRKIISEQFPYL